MWGFLIAMISGALMSIQGVFNTNVTKATSIWVAGGYVQITAFFTCLVMWFVSGQPEIAGIVNVEHKLSLLGGVIGAFITFTVIKSIEGLGTAPAILTIVITQTAVAYVIEVLGLFGSEKAEFSWVKVLGLAIAIGGVVLFNMTGAKTS